MDLTPLLTTFSLIAIAELGDKNAAYRDRIIGRKLCGIVPLPKIKLGASALFILFGISFLAGF